ncbi:microtubule-associated protein 10 [Ascaphus truei]|uniref:microtubule-associated protein 10 n=1 Tax=Ascaphus truei TaxID=8439 RepID=UPI003F59180E
MLPGAHTLVHASPPECVFSLELLVNDVLVDRAALGLVDKPLPALAFRLLDFPTLLVYPGPENEEEGGGEEASGPTGLLHLPFGRGKSCLFRLSLHSLQRRLSQSPLYVLLLDLRPRLPLLLGSCLLSMSEAARGVREEAERGPGCFPVPCWRGAKGEHPLYDLMGRRVGRLSLGYRLLCLGGSVMGHLGMSTEHKVVQGGYRHLDDAESGCIVPNHQDGPALPTSIMVPPASTSSPIMPSVTQVPSSSEGKAITLETPVAAFLYKDHLEREVQPHASGQNQSSVSTQTEQKSRHPPRLDVADSLAELEAQANVFCPPPLYYNHDTEPKPVGEQPPRENNSVSAARPLVGEDMIDSDSEEDSVKKANQGACEFTEDISIARRPHQKRQSGPYPKPILNQLPFLNALLLELSLLNDQMPIPSQTAVHPQLAWLYTNAVGGESYIPMRNNKPKLHVEEVLPKALKKPSSPKLKKNRPEGLVSKTPSSLSENHAEKESHRDGAQGKAGALKADGHGRNKLFYGLTKTLRLRLQETNPDVLLMHERREQNRKRQIEISKQQKWRSRGILSKGKIPKSSIDCGQETQKVIPLNHRSFDENVETLIQNNNLNNMKDYDPRRQEPPPASAHVLDPYKNSVGMMQPLAEKSFSSLENSTSEPQKEFERDVKVNLPRSMVQDSVCEQEVTNYLSSISSDSQVTGSGNYKQGAHNLASSPDHIPSGDLIASLDYSGYLDDFTSPDYTGRYSEAFDSSTEPALLDVIKVLSCSDSENSRHSSAKSDSLTANLSASVLSNASPVPSYEIRQGLKTEKSISMRTSQVSSYLPSNMSDLELSRLESTSHEKQNVNGTMTISNQYKHMSELQVNQLPGYTL